MKNTDDGTSSALQARTLKQKDVASSAERGRVQGELALTVSLVVSRIVLSTTSTAERCGESQEKRC